MNDSTQALAHVVGLDIAVRHTELVQESERIEHLKSERGHHGVREEVNSE